MVVAAFGKNKHCCKCVFILDSYVYVSWPFPGYLSCEDRALDVVFIVDSSYSVVKFPNGWETVKYIIKQIVRRLEIGPKGSLVGLVTFDSEAITQWTLPT